MSGSSHQPSAPPRTCARHWVLVAGVIAIAAVLRFAFLGTKSFDVDETASFTYAQLDWAAFLRALARDSNMWLYYALLRLWARLGDSEAALRSLSVVFAVATLAVVYALGARLFGRRVGLIALALLSVNAFHIAYAQNARGYSLVTFLIALSSLLFVRGIERRSWQDWAGYVLASTLAIYSHLFAGLALVAQWASLVTLSPRRVPWKALSISVILIGCLSLPLGVFAVNNPASTRGPNLKDLAGLFYDLAGGADPRTVLLRAPSVVYLLLCLVAFGTAATLWRSRAPSHERWPYALLFTWLWVPILLAFAMSALKPIFLRRYLIICLPALVLLAAVGLSQIRRRWLFVGALVALVSLALHGVYYYYIDTPYETGDQDNRGATYYILVHAQPGDALLIYASWMQKPFDYYRRRSRDSLSGSVITILPDRAWQESSIPRYRRTWVYFSHSDRRTEHAIEAWLAGRYAAMVERQFIGVRVLLYSESK